MICRVCGRTPEQVAVAAALSGIAGIVARTRWRVIEDENGGQIADLICWWCFVWFCRAARKVAA